MNSNNIITLYHGSIYDFKIIDINKGKPYKDFGNGFYTSRSEPHATNFAIRNKEIETERNALRNKNIHDTAWLYIYEFDLNHLDLLNTKEFLAPDREWMQFVVLNRMNKTKQHDYDIVIGATANDNTRVSIQTVLSAANGQLLNERALDALITLIEPDNLPPQYFFGTQRAVELLQLKNRRKL